MEELVCHCFGYTASDIERERTEQGRSLLAERIQATLRMGGSLCSIRHPQGR